MPIVTDFKNITEMFLKLADNFENSDKFALMKKVEGKYIGITYKEMRDKAKTFGFGLASLGIKPGDKVAILAENRPEWVYSDMGILMIGGIDVPIYPSLTASTVEFILNDSEAKAIIVSNKLHLNKVLKVRQNLRHLKNVIIMNAKDAADSVLSFEYVQNLGFEFSKKFPDYLNKTTKKISPSDICTIIYTSGTTGDPKGVMLTHNNFVSNVKASSKAFDISDKDLLLSFLPLSHVFERMAGYYTCMACGATLAYADSVETVADNMIEIKPTIITTVPRLFERIYSKIKKSVDNSPPHRQKIFYWAVDCGIRYFAAKKEKKINPFLSLRYVLADKLVFGKIRARTGGRLRFFVSGGAALPRDIGEFFEAVGITILEGYGLTETSPVIAVNRLEDYKFGTVGKPIEGIEVKIATDGEILTRGPHIMKGYYKNKKATDEVLTKDGWFHTGDLGVFDADGFLMITDRKKHLFKTSGGKYIAPQQIENVFLKSKYIEQFILIGDNKTFLSALIAPDFDSIKEYADAHKIPYENISDLTNSEEINQLVEKDIELLQKNLANYEKIRRFVLLDKPLSIDSGELTPTLKVKRKVVEERYSDLINSLYLESKREKGPGRRNWD